MQLATLDHLYQKMGFSEAPFNLTPDTDFFFSSETHQEALKHLRYGQLKGGFSVLTGEVGMGKTLLCRQLLKDNDDVNLAVTYIYNPAGTITDLISSIYHSLMGVSIDVTNAAEVEQKFISLLIDYAQQGKRVVVVIDESHLLDETVLDSLRTLANLESAKVKLLSFVLVGQPELLITLRKHALRSLRQRVTTHYRLRMFSYHDTSAYLNHRLAVSRLQSNVCFTKPAELLLHALCRGTPRRINQIADRSLMAAFLADKTKVSMAMVWAANKEVFI